MRSILINNDVTRGRRRPRTTTPRRTRLEKARERETLTLTRIRLTKDPLVKKRTLNDGVKEEEEEEEEEVVVKESTVDRCKTGTC